MPEQHTGSMRVMSIMAHQDDFELTAGGTFAALRQAYGDRVQMRVLTTTRGASGHHQISSEETFRRREAEARSSAALIGADYECLVCLDGSHLHGQVFVDRNVCGGLWNAIRDFEPDVVFCPPVPQDPLAGVHIDHCNTALAIRLIAYQLIVPNAYPTMNGPVKTRFRQPLIVNVDDGYSEEAVFHVRQDVRETYERKLEMFLCHESQVFEWLPFTYGYDRAWDRDEVRAHLAKRHQKMNERYGQSDDIPSEYFRITRWARNPRPGEIERVFPGATVDRYTG